MKLNLLFFSGTLAFSSLAAQHKMPNVVFFISDDQSQADASIYGAPVLLKTPALKLLAEDGLVFDRAFIASPSCAPSRAALLTGLMPARNGAEANHTYPQSVDMYLTRKLQSAGFEVSAFGKVVHGKTDKAHGFDYTEAVGLREDLAGAVQRYFADRRTADKPQFIMVGDHRPHVPWIEESIYHPEEVTLPSYFIDTRETREHWAQYMTDITGLDAEIGKVYAWARQTFGSDLIFVFTSDHGGQWPFAKWNLYDAGILVPLVVVWPDHIKPGTRTGAMVSWTDILPTLFDACGIGIPANLDGSSFKHVLTGGSDAHRSKVFTTHTGDGEMNVYPIRSVRTEKYKYIRNLLPGFYHTNHSDIIRRPNAGRYWDSWELTASGDERAAQILQRYFIRPPEELYDVLLDPQEQNNLIGDPAFQAVIEKMRDELDQWMMEQGDSGKVFNTPYPVDGPKPRR